MQWIKPDWPVPKQVKAISTTRMGGVSQPPYDSLNLGTHVEDGLQDVLMNRRLIKDTLKLPSEPAWLNQTHSTQVLDVDSNVPMLAADASVSQRRGACCVIMTADCLPVLLTNKAGTVIGAAHAGWRGLSNGVLEATLQAMVGKEKGLVSSDIMVWLGPAIGSQHFEVGEEVRQVFIEQHSGTEEAFVASTQRGKWLADIYQLARIRLAAIGVTDVYGGGYCTYQDDQRFFSYRREEKTGRMASLIWLD